MKKITPAAKVFAAAAGAFALAFLLAGCVQAGGDLPPTPTAATVSTCSPPGTNPKFIAILLQGISSSVEMGTNGASGSFNPATASYCTSPDGQSPPDNPQLMLQDLADAWLNWNCPVGFYAPCRADDHTVYYPHDLIDALAHAGGYVLPFSYVGAKMSGAQAHPVFRLTPYTSDDVATSNPTMYDIAKMPGGPLARQEPKVLDDEITSIHQVFKHTPILVIGHSNGGLIAEQWWEHFHKSVPTPQGFKDADGVMQVFSLDSPLNGVALANPLIIIGVLGPVQHVVGDAYVKLWAHKQQDDAYAIGLDHDQPSLFTPVGSYGDPLYDAANSGSVASPVTNRANFLRPGAGIISQLFMSQQCLNSGVLGTGFNEIYNVISSQCQPVVPPDFASPCAQHWNQGEDYSLKYPWPEYGFVRPVGNSRWMHSLVKNCPGVISEILSFAQSPAAQSSPSQTPAAQPSPAASSPSPSASAVVPGYMTPGDAVDGFYQGELAGDWAAVCSYVVPSAQALCLAGTSGQGAATGHVTIGNAVISGSEALVPVTGSICAPSSPCVTNSDPSLGMPPSPSQFPAYYQRAVANGSSSSTTAMSPMPCSEIGGKWYVAFG